MNQCRTTHHISNFLFFAHVPCQNRERGKAISYKLCIQMCKCKAASTEHVPCDFTLVTNQAFPGGPLLVCKNKWSLGFTNAFRNRSRTRVVSVGIRRKKLIFLSQMIQLLVAGRYIDQLIKATLMASSLKNEKIYVLTLIGRLKDLKHFLFFLKFSTNFIWFRGVFSGKVTLNNT